MTSRKRLLVRKSCSFQFWTRNECTDETGTQHMDNGKVACSPFGRPFCRWVPRGEPLASSLVLGSTLGDVAGRIPPYSSSCRSQSAEIDLQRHGQWYSSATLTKNRLGADRPPSFFLNYFRAVSDISVKLHTSHASIGNICEEMGKSLVIFCVRADSGRPHFLLKRVAVEPLNISIKLSKGRS